MQRTGGVTTDLNSHVQGLRPRGLPYPRFIHFLFGLFAIYLVLPIYDVPLLGLSISAPIFFVIAVSCILKPPSRWFHAFRGWILLAVVLWVGIFISAVANGLVSGGVNLDRQGISLVVHYAFWMLVFVMTAYFASQEGVLQGTSDLLGWAVFALAVLRWLEVLIWRNVGAWTGTHLLTQNTYGFLFSTFSPFLLVRILEARGEKRLVAVAGNVTLWAAVAINGSRGSWVSIASGLAMCLIVLAILRPSKIPALMAAAILVGGMAWVTWMAFPEGAARVADRFDTFQTLGTDKSYMIRQLMIQKAQRLFAQSPLIGVGAGRFTQASIPLDIPGLLAYANQVDFDTRSSHNSYLDLLAESGLAGAVPFAILLITLTWGGLRSTFRFLRDGGFWMLAVFLGFLQMSIHMWAIASLTNTGTWFVYGLTAAAIAVANRKDVAA